MSTMVEKDLCDERNNSLKSILDTHEKRLNNHGGRIDSLEQYRSKSETQIINLCDQIKSLVSTINRFIILLITSLIGIVGTLGGFIIWYIQQLK